MPLDDVFNAALELPEVERVKLAGRLMETLPVPDEASFLDDPALVRELDRRFSDRNGSIPWSELRKER